MAKENDPDVKSIMISAYGKDKELKEKARSAGINAFIDKPFLITDLLDAVDDILRHSPHKEAASQ